MIMLSVGKGGWVGCRTDFTTIIKHWWCVSIVSVLHFNNIHTQQVQPSYFSACPTSHTGSYKLKTWPKPRSQREGGPAAVCDRKCEESSDLSLSFYKTVAWQTIIYSVILTDLRHDLIYLWENITASCFRNSLWTEWVKTINVWNKSTILCLMKINISY